MGHFYRYNSLGLTLVELMIAMLIGIIMIGGTIQIFIGNKIAYNFSQESGYTQENARYALDLLAKDIRMAGYMGCLNQGITNANDIVQAASKPIAGGTSFFDDPIMGYDGQSNSGDNLTDWLPNLPNYFSSGQAIAGSDVIVIQQSYLLRASQVGNIQANPSYIQIDDNFSNDPITAGDTLLLSDCINTDIFLASNVAGAAPVTITHANTVNTSSSLSKLYGANARLMRVIMNGYYIGTNADNNRALFRTSLGSNGLMTAQELVEGVETMQIAYGEDLSGDGLPNRYVAANDISNTDDIVTVRIGLLLYTTKEIATENESRTFNLAGTNVGSTSTIPTHGADKALRQTYSITVKIRNRGME